MPKLKTLEEETKYIKTNESVMLIRWDKSSGQFRILFSGQPIHITSAEALFDAIKAELNKNLTKEGLIRASVREEEEPNWTPPWETKE